MIATLAPESGTLDLFLQAADDETLLSPLEVTLQEIGAQAVDGISKISVLKDKVVSEIGSLIPGYRDYKMGNVFEEAETSFLIDQMGKAVAALREGHEIKLGSDFIHDTLKARSHADAFEKWDPAALVKARDSKFGNLADAAWQQALQAVKNIVHCRHTLPIDPAKKTVTISAYLFEKVDYGRDAGNLKQCYRADDMLVKLKLFLRVVMSLHTGQAFDTCNTDLPHTIKIGRDGSMPPRDLYRWQESDTQGITRIRPYVNGTLVFEFSNEETFRRFVTEMEAIPSPW